MFLILKNLLIHSTSCNLITTGLIFSSGGRNRKISTLEGKVGQKTINPDPGLKSWN